MLFLRVPFFLCHPLPYLDSHSCTLYFHPMQNLQILHYLTVLSVLVTVLRHHVLYPFKTLNNSHKTISIEKLIIQIYFSRDIFSVTLVHCFLLNSACLGNIEVYNVDQKLYLWSSEKSSISFKFLRSKSANIVVGHLTNV